MKLGPVLAGLLLAAPALADVTVDGLVTHPHQWAMSDLEAQPAVVIDLAYQTGHGGEKGRFTGVPLWRLLSEAGLPDDKGKNPAIRHYIVATGADGYSAIFSYGELDPDLEGKSVLVAYKRDGIQTPDLQLVVPGDKKGARYVHDLVHVEVH